MPRAAGDVLLEQERVLQCERFGAAEALELGCALAALAPDFGEGVSVTITRESDGVRMFQWVADDKTARNLQFAEGKRAAALKAGHAGPWAQLQAAASEDLASVWSKVPDEVPACGAFPLRSKGDWVATVAVSGLSNGEDHEVILRALEQVLGVDVPRWKHRWHKRGLANAGRPARLAAWQAQRRAQ